MSYLIALKAPVLWSYAWLFALLTLLSSVPWLVGPFRPQVDFRDYKRRAWGFWIISLTTLVFLTSGPRAFAVFMGGVAMLAQAELLRLSPEPLPRALRLATALTTALPFGLLAVSDWSSWAPLSAMIAAPVILAASVVAGPPMHYMQRTGLALITTLIAGTCFGCIAALGSMPDSFNPAAGGPGLFMFVGILAQFNDWTQYFWGKVLGRRQIVPLLSPAKTWEGFAGGVLTTAASAWLLAPLLTPIPGRWAPLAGAAIAIAGFWGDLTISALKRSAGVKDTGTILPGFGGLMDRVDSLIYVGPAFYGLMLILGQP
jgi:phosphatidate cytidylyltransferase